jgi:DNA-binding NtrC family response regulator/tetratricopeptide (TPR) repeat protein
MAMTADIDALISAGRFREAAEALDALRDTSPGQRAVRVQLQSELEGARSAAPNAAPLLKERLTSFDRAACQEILARASVYSGDIRNGLRLFDAALKLVENDVIHAARLQLRFTYAVLNWIGIEPALTRLPALHKAVTQSGDPYSSIALHLVCAEIEIKRDIKSRAEMHLQAADTLAQSFPHLGQQAKLFQLRSIRAAWEARFCEALELAETSLRAAQRAGWKQGCAAALANIAHFSLLIGDVDKAHTFLEAAKDSLPLPDPMGVCVRATEVDLSLARGDCEAAGAIIDEVQREARELEERHAFYALWFNCSRVRYLTRSGRVEEALRLAADLIPYADRYADEHLRVSLRLHGAEAAFHCRRVAVAIRLLTDVIKGSDLAVEHLGELQRIIGLLTSLDGSDGARIHFDIAERLFTSVGLATFARELSNSRRLVSSDSQTHAEPEHNVFHVGSCALSILESWATVVDCSSIPEACGTELLKMLQMTDLAEAAVLIKQVADGPKQIVTGFGNGVGAANADNCQSIEIAQQHGERWEIVIQPTASVAATLAMSMIDRAFRRIRAAQVQSAKPLPPSLLVAHESKSELGGMIVAAENMCDVVRITQRVASGTVTVLFSGETGTGKELLARMLHECSTRREKVFSPFNCTAISRDMIDSQLFGYRRGAFTGAHDAFPGVIRAASGGTLFLDEIGELPLDVQPKLLRFLESGEIHPLGEPKPVNVDVRVVAATNANLELLVSEGRFREDLYYRLNVVRLHVPPLRERREEIPLLVRHFVDKFSRDARKTGIRLAEETMEYLVLFTWPGNVRQLANEIRRIVALADSCAVVMPEHLAHEISSSRRTVPVSDRPVAPMEFVVRMDQPLAAAMRHLERSMVQYALASAGDRLEDAAQMLGLSRKGLYLKRQRLNLNAAPPAEDDESEEPQPETHL